MNSTYICSIVRGGGGSGSEESAKFPKYVPLGVEANSTAIQVRLVNDIDVVHGIFEFLLVKKLISLIICYCISMF